MALSSPNEATAGHPMQARVRDGLAAIAAFTRRHIRFLLYGLALVAVPAAVIVFTGGSDSVGFWIVTIVWMMGVAYGAILAVFVALLILSPLLLVVSKVSRGRVEAAVARVSRWMVAGLSIAGFLAFAPLGDGSGVRLPVSWPNLGAVIVLTLAIAASYSLWMTGRRLRPPKRQPVPMRRHSVPEPDDVYWSDQFVVGWRSWNWDGSSLRGVYARWRSDEFVATCGHCDVVPSWEHVCGVYAAKGPNNVHVFYGWSPIVGRVEMWGDVVEHENGYRASHARITDLWVHDLHRAERIRAAYPSINVVVGSPRLEQEAV